MFIDDDEDGHQDGWKVHWKWIESFLSARMFHVKDAFILLFANPLNPIRSVAVF